MNTALEILTSRPLGSNVKFHEIFSQWKIQWFSYRIFTYGVKKSWNFHWNFRRNFHCQWKFRRKFQWKFQWKFHDFLTPHVKIRQDDISKKSITVYRKFRYFRGWFDTIRYIDIESIFSIYRSITTAAAGDDDSRHGTWLAADRPAAGSPSLAFLPPDPRRTAV